MSHSGTASTNSNFFPGYFNSNGNPSSSADSMAISSPPPPPPLPAAPPPLDPSQPPPPPPVQQIDLSVPPPVRPKIDTSVPPPTAVLTPELYQSWALQWQLYQQAQMASYQSQIYQAYTNQSSTTSNGTNTQQYNAPAKNSAPPFRPRQVQQSYRARATNNNNSTNFPSYNNVPPPSNLAPSKPRASAIRFQLNVRPQENNERPARRSRFSSPPKQAAASAKSVQGTMSTPMETDEPKPVMDAIHAFKLSCDREKWPDSLKKYWQSIEIRCTTGFLRSRADEWFQNMLVDAFQKNLVETTDWMNKPIPDFLLRPDVRSNNFDSTTSSLVELAKSSYAENKRREELTKLNKLRQVTSESVQRAFADDDPDDEEENQTRRSSTSSSSSSTDNESNNLKVTKPSPAPILSNSARKRLKKNRRGKKTIKKMMLDDAKPETCERLEKRKKRFDNETVPMQIKPIQAPGTFSTVSETTNTLVGTCQKLEKNFLRLTSEADPAMIRPLSVLERAFSFVMDKYRLNNDWSYISDQLRSIRQDLMVQSIRNDFTVLVYEENARISLAMGDREQFNQCQTQLETLYENGCNRTHLNEFLVYRLLYSLLLNDHKKTTRILIDIETVKKHAAANGRSKAEDIKHLNLALDLCTAIRRKNYTHFFIIYRSLPRLACCLVNLFIDIYRKQLVKALVWGFAPSLSIEVLTKMLAYETDDHCQQQLIGFGLIFSDSSSIDCKASRAVFEKK